MRTHMRRRRCVLSWQAHRWHGLSDLIIDSRMTIAVMGQFLLNFGLRRDSLRSHGRRIR
jgi:hypothetical protein